MAVTLTKHQEPVAAPGVWHGRSWWERATGRWSWLRVLIVLAVTAGVSLWTYPFIGNWFQDALHAEELAEYAREVQHLSTEERDRILANALEYNEHMPNGPLRDPYALDENGRPAEIGEGKDAYYNALNVDGKGLMGALVIPKIKVSLPIHHDTDAKALDAGVGHLYGSGVPVGGIGTHSVLTAHSGVVGATLFTDLAKLENGDQFQVQVLGETLTYEVDKIQTVLPNDLEALRQIPGSDHVTLVTCTPIGVNTHRLLVRGIRVPTPPSDEGAGLQAQGAGFPWWVIPIPASILLLVFGTRFLSLPSMAALGAAAAAAPGGAQEQGAHILFSFRPVGSPDYQIWEKQFKRIFGVSRVAPQYRRTQPADTGPGGAGEGGVYTWTLVVDGARVGVSANAYATLEEARENARYSAAGQLRVGVRSTLLPGRAYWVAGNERAPIFMATGPTRGAEHTREAGEIALLQLAHALREVGVRTDIALPQHRGDTWRARLKSRLGTNNGGK